MQTPGIPKPVTTPLPTTATASSLPPTQNMLNAVLNLPQTFSNLRTLNNLTKSFNPNGGGMAQDDPFPDLAKLVKEENDANDNKDEKPGLYNIFVLKSILIISGLIILINQSGHERCRHRLGIPISKYFSKIFSSSHIKLSNNNPNKYF